MYFSEHKGVFFIEGSPPNANRLGTISTEINNFFGQNQLKSLDDVKDKMCQKVLSKGGNSIINFKYGQRSTFWKSLIGMDDVLWYGSGEIARVNPDDLM